MSAQNATDLQSFVDRLNAVYTRLKDCPTSGVTCTNTPAVVSYQFDQNTPHMFLSHSRLLSLNSALTSLLDDTAIQRGFRTAEDCVGCDSSTGYSVPELCAILDGLGLSEMRQPHNHAFNNDAWLTYAEALLTGIENLFDSGSDCPNFVCAPSTCPAGLADEYIVLAGAGNQGSVGNLIVYTLADAIVTRVGSTCVWEGVVDMSIDGTVFEDIDVTVYLDTENCRWVLGLWGDFATGFKLVGIPPAGAYSEEPNAELQVFSGTVTEAT